MQKENYNVLGVMSGTSLDGVDLAHIILQKHDGKWSFELKETVTVAYSQDWVERLKEAVSFTKGELAALNTDYTILLSGIIKEYIKEHSLNEIDAVCSHGHTILHRPQDGVTLQIGNLTEIASLTGHKVVCDFRVQDVQLGGQGAPLVPIGDRLLFSEYTYCLNLGGFSNISFEQDGKRIAFDICPVNTVLNHFANSLGLEYDAGGELASKGSMIYPLYTALENLEFYKLDYPKSLGFEFVKETILPLMKKYEGTIEDKLHTFTQHIASRIASTIKQRGENGSLLITGGGAYNTFLIKRLQELLPNTIVAIPDDKTIQFKEALIFGLLGVLKLRNEVNTLASVTGATTDHSAGKIYLPTEYRSS